MQSQLNYPLKKFNTFGLEVAAKEYISITSEEQLQIVVKENSDTKLFVLGGGSNMLLTQDIPALVLHIQILGKSIVKEDNDFVWIEAMAGENWHEFVLFAIQNNYGGLENMSLIPGNVGTTPIQNIGAYGAEIKDSMISCHAIEIKTAKKHTFLNADCQFGYRESIFKSDKKNQFIITSVVFKLTKRNHKIAVGYGDITKELAKNDINKPTIKQVSDAVIAIRQSKLPDPKVLGNCGSFFKNPILKKEAYLEIKTIYPEIPCYEIDTNLVKVPAGWLIEQAGFKGKRFGDAGVHVNQALVIVNYGMATGSELVALSKKIQAAVFEKFKINIEAEVNII